jgi:hypothetical protein
MKPEDLNAWHDWWIVISVLGLICIARIAEALFRIARALKK